MKPFLKIQRYEIAVYKIWGLVLFFGAIPKARGTLR